MKQVRNIHDNNRQYLIGTSFSACMRDIISGKVKKEDVCFLYTHCKFHLDKSAEDNIDFMIAEHVLLGYSEFANINPEIRSWLVHMMGEGKIIGRERIEITDEQSPFYFYGLSSCHPHCRYTNWFAAVEFTVPKRAKDMAMRVAQDIENTIER